MTLADDLLPVAYEARAIAGSLGFRPHRFYVVVTHWSGQHTGERELETIETEITEANGQPPRVEQMKTEEIALGQLPSNTLKVGPITPAFSGGGTSDDLLFGKLPTGSTRIFKITGPLALGGGALYQLSGSQRDRALRRILFVSPITAEP